MRNGESEWRCGRGTGNLGLYFREATGRFKAGEWCDLFVVKRSLWLLLEDGHRGRRDQETQREVQAELVRGWLLGQGREAQPSSGSWMNQTG